MIADMLAARAGTLPALKAVRPSAVSRHDDFPLAVYETVDMRNKRYMNCVSKQYDGVVRFYVCGKSYEDVIANSEALKDALIGYAVVGPAYRIVSTNHVGEGDIDQEEDDDGPVCYAKSIDFAVRALKL